MPRLFARLTALLTLVALGAPDALAACPMRPEHAAIAARDVLAGFAAQSPTLRRTDLSVACLSAVPTPAQSAAIYSANGVIQLTLGDEQAALLWLQAMVEADPEAQLSPTLAPPEHPLYALEAQARASQPSPRGAAPVPRRRTLWVDGVESTTVPLNRPALVALTDERGEVVWSDLVAPGVELEAEWRGPRVPLWAYGGAVAFVGCYAGFVYLVANGETSGP